MQHGQLNVTFLVILNQVLNACNYNPEFSIDFDSIQIPPEPLLLLWDLHLGNRWWNWNEETKKDVAAWWKNPSPDMSFNQLIDFKLTSLCIEL